MNRPALPIAISSVPATELPFASLDRASFSATIIELLQSFDERDTANHEFVTVSADLFRPVPARAHVNQSRRTEVRSRLLASA